MQLKNKNLLNIFNIKDVNDQSMTLLVLALLPGLFVTKSIEATLIYLLLYAIFIILVTLVFKLIEKIVPNDINWIVVIVSVVGVSAFVAILANAFFVNFAKDYELFIYLFAVSSLPYMLNADNEKKNVGKSLVNSLQSFIGLVIIMLFVSILREVIGTGMIVFGNYSEISFNVNLFSKNAISIINEPLGAIIILGLLLAAIQLGLNKKGERA
ncbi:Rnf-Nqr domain containing protein [Haploplasma axanthum]|nr:Rnf-Nqr domain containing protein [Haploplasma axanthum]